MMGCISSTAILRVLGSSRMVRVLRDCMVAQGFKNILNLQGWDVYVSGLFERWLCRYHSKSRFFFLGGTRSRQSSPSSPHPGCQQFLSLWRQIHSFFSESYFTQASVMQCNLSKAPETILESFSSGRSQFTYCDSFSSSLMSALVPTPLGRRAAASRTRVRMVTQAGRSLFSKGWSRGFPVRTDSFLATGATVTFLPSSQLYTQGLVGLEYRWNSCLRQFSTHQLFLGLTGRVILYIAAFLSIFSYPSASSSSWPLILEWSYLKQTLWLYSSSMKSSISYSVSVAWLFSDMSSIEERSFRLSTDEPSSSKVNFSVLVPQERWLRMVLSRFWQISFILKSLSLSFISSSFSRKLVKQPFFNFRSKFCRWPSQSPFPSRAYFKVGRSCLGSRAIRSCISSWVKCSVMLFKLTISFRSTSSSFLGRTMVSASWRMCTCAASRTVSSCPSMGWSCECSASVSVSTLASRVFLMLLQTLVRQSQYSVLLKRCAIINALPIINSYAGVSIGANIARVLLLERRERTLREG